MPRFKPIPRRTFLKGAGAAIGLPLLECMLPLPAWGATGKAKRVAFICFENGAKMADWLPSQQGENYVLPPILEPLEAVKDYVLVTSGLDLDIPYIPEPNTDHTASNLLTCLQPRFVGNTYDARGQSIDQLIADRIGSSTRLASLVIGNEDYGPIKDRYYSWSRPTKPHELEINPALVFDMLFKGVNPMPPPAAPKIDPRTLDKSVLDFVLDDAKKLQNKVGKADQEKLDEYLTSVRELEKRLDGIGSSPPMAACVPGTKPRGNGSYEERVSLMYDLIVKAFQCDATRVVCYGLQKGLAATPYNFLGSGFGTHHDISHDDNDKLAQIVGWHIQQFSSFLTKLRNSKEGDGNLLDHSIIFLGSQLSDGEGDHWHTDLPILVAGKGGGAVKTGRHVRFSNRPAYYRSHRLNGTRVANLYVAIAQAMGVDIASFADSTGAANLG